ncbi:hypothetical protein DQ04_02041070 [Trypanosoma grayi]|uniref:hypothetical protein n=1 Tax=Trypanosoma grayi TaxID=71804 RepID=UPI0004F49E24|nr:hypothetical protein DQ04_02041070 [Trypanosoma grayi]KEG12055.1 hypothetical protein DQ04_02041070 [Trypanosoma grayi]
MTERPLAAASPHPAGAIVFLRDGDAPTSTCAPIALNGSVTMRELAEEYCISSVLECDATGCVQPRAVALDSPLDTLHGGKYYIARRDLPRVRRSPRVAFRGKITVEEFEADHAVTTQQKENYGLPAVAAIHFTRKVSRKRQQRDEDGEGENEDHYKKETEDDDDDAGLMYDNIEAATHTFAPFVGDLYGDGREELIQLKDIHRLCENVESDEAEFFARHAQANRVLFEAKKALLLLSGSGGTEGGATVE